MYMFINFLEKRIFFGYGIVNYKYFNSIPDSFFRISGTSSSYPSFSGTSSKSSSLSSIEKHNIQHLYQLLLLSCDHCLVHHVKKNCCLEKRNLTITIFILLLKWHHFKIIEFVLDLPQLRFKVNNSFEVFLFSSMFG